MECCPRIYSILTLVEDAQFSPDGSTVAFVPQVDRWAQEADAYRSEIWVVPTAGGDVRAFTTGPREDAHPRWSPDGRWLAFLSNRAGEKKQLWLMPSGGGEARLLAEQGEGIRDFASVS